MIHWMCSPVRTMLFSRPESSHTTYFGVKEIIQQCRNPFGKCVDDASLDVLVFGSSLFPNPYSKHEISKVHSPIRCNQAISGVSFHYETCLTARTPIPEPIEVGLGKGATGTCSPGALGYHLCTNTASIPLGCVISGILCRGLFLSTGQKSTFTSHHGCAKPIDGYSMMDSRSKPAGSLWLGPPAWWLRSGSVMYWVDGKLYAEAKA